MEKDISHKDFHPVLSIRGRIYFLQLARYGKYKYKEQRYRQYFKKRFDFLSFKKELILSQVNGRYAIIFDPGLNNSQARSKNKLHFQLNVSLTY